MGVVRWYSRSMIYLAIALFIGLLWPVNALADITGKPRVIDGDTLEIAGERIRLHGIDAPESEQTCIADGLRWHCGMEAASALAFKIARGWVGCQGQDRDRGRPISRPTAFSELLSFMRRSCASDSSAEIR